MQSKSNGRVTIIDIAKAVNLSPATVSLALNDKGSMPDERRALIKNIAREMHYMPSPVARALRGGSTRSIGVVINHFNNPFFRQFFIGLERVADTMGLTFFVTQSHDALEKEQQQVRQLAQQGVDGLIVLPCALGSAHLQAVRATWNIPVVLISNSLGDGFPLVTVDNLAGGALVAEHFLSLPPRPNLHLGGPPAKMPMRLRWQGYREALQRRQPAFDAERALFRVDSLRAEDGFNIMPSILNSVSPPFNLFVVNDEVALGVLRYCREHALRVPEDIAIAGFSNVDILDSYGIPLTTVESSAEHMGEAALEMLIMLMEAPDKRLWCPQVINPVSLIVRGSSRPPSPLTS